MPFWTTLMPVRVKHKEYRGVEGVGYGSGVVWVVEGFISPK